MRSLTLKLKLQISFALMVIITVIIGITSYFSLNNIQDDLNEIFEVRLPALDFLLEADRDLQQLLVAERSMIFTSPQDELFGRLIKDYEANREQAETRFNKYKQLASTDFERDYINQFDQAFSDWKPVSQSVVSDRQTNTDESNKRAMKLSLGESNKRFEKMRDNINKLQEYSLKSAEKAHNQAMQTYKTTIAIMIGLVVFGIVVGAFLGFFLNRQISKPLDHFNNVIGEVSTVIKSSSKMLNDISTDLASGMAQQAASVEETSASLVELKEMVQSNVNNAEHSSGQSKRVKEISETGHESMNELQISIEKIQESNTEIEELVTVIANIGDKTKIMDEIVFQTKLLSFNASVEAERAGEHGRGFAVVAQEVGNLASLSGKAALEIADIVGRSISKAENITKENKEKVESGARAVQSAEKIFVEVKGSADEVAESSSQVLQASQEQAKGVDQINEAIQQIDQLTQKNTHLAEETSMGSQKLNDQIDVLDKITVDIDHLVNGY